MRYKYSTLLSGQDMPDSLPRLPLLLQSGSYSIEALGLVDSGATVNVLPFELGEKLGFAWDDSKATIRLARNIQRSGAIPILLRAQLADFSPVTLAFAWIPHDDAPVILGQANFFKVFEVCFFGQALEFEVNLKK